MPEIPVPLQVDERDLYTDERLRVKKKDTYKPWRWFLVYQILHKVTHFPGCGQWAALMVAGGIYTRYAMPRAEPAAITLPPALDLYAPDVELQAWALMEAVLPTVALDASADTRTMFERALRPAPVETPDGDRRWQSYLSYEWERRTYFSFDRQMGPPEIASLASGFRSRLYRGLSPLPDRDAKELTACADRARAVCHEITARLEGRR